MANILNRIVIFLLLIGMSGCVAPATQSRLSDERLSVHSSLNGSVVFESLVDDVNSGGFTEVQLRGFNSSNAIRKIEYRVTWFDGRGMAIKSILSRWNKMTLVNDMPFQIQAISPKTGISSFLIQIKKVGDSGFNQEPDNNMTQG